MCLATWNPESFYELNSTRSSRVSQDLSQTSKDSKIRLRNFWILNFPQSSPRHDQDHVQVFVPKTDLDLLTVSNDQ